MNTKKNPVVHFEMPVSDRKRVSKFYTEAFGWEMKQYGPEMGHYIVAITTESDDKGPKKPGAINGGFFTKSSDKPDQYPSVVITVEDIVAHIEKIKNAGGEILDEPIEIPSVGTYVSFRDTEGNRVAMLQPSQQM